MGTACKVTLPPGCRVGDVADVMGLAAGLPGHMVAIEHHTGLIYALRVDGAKVETTSVPEMVRIVLKGAMVDGETSHSAFYHFEPERADLAGCTAITMQRSTPFWIAVGLRVVEFFGGTIDLNDCDDIEVDAVFPQAHRHANDGQPWQDHQDAMAAVEPVTLAAVAAR